MSDGLIDQILREWPPGYGGVERVAHELACVWGGTVYSLDAQSLALREADVVAVGADELCISCFMCPCTTVPSPLCG